MIPHLVELSGTSNSVTQQTELPKSMFSSNCFENNMYLHQLRSRFSRTEKLWPERH